MCYTVIPEADLSGQDRDDIYHAAFSRILGVAHVYGMSAFDPRRGWW